MLAKRTKKITVRFPKRLRGEMQAAILAEQYGARGKSKWLSEAIEYFINHGNYLDLVDNGTGMNQSDLAEVEAFYLEESAKNNLKNALLQVRQKYPLFEGVQSALIRACVVYRLMLKSGFLPGRK